MNLTSTLIQNSYFKYLASYIFGGNSENKKISMTSPVTMRLHGDKEMIFRIQNDLFDLGADLCVPENDSLDYEPLRISQTQVDRLESEIDEMNSNLEPLQSFILPGGSIESAYLHLARTSARKAERLIIGLSQKEKINPICIKYINRLSDHLFVIARFVNKQNKKNDILWVPGKSRK